MKEEIDMKDDGSKTERRVRGAKLEMVQGTESQENVDGLLVHCCG